MGRQRCPIAENMMQSSLGIVNTCPSRLFCHQTSIRHLLVNPPQASGTLSPTSSSLAPPLTSCFQILQQLAAARRVSADEKQQANTVQVLKQLDDLYEELEEVFCEYWADITLCHAVPSCGTHGWRGRVDI